MKINAILLDKKVASWALYDWANSAFSTTIVAGFFPVYYNILSADLSTADSQFWFNITLAISSIIIAIAAPILGAIADYGGKRKKFLAVFALQGIIMCVGLAWVGAGAWWMALVVYGLGQIGFSGANVFYDAMIMEVTDDETVDVVSGYGYALGYLGGGLLFLLNVLMVTMPQNFGLPDAASALSWSFISVAVWWLIFTLPLLRNIDEPGTGKTLSAGCAVGYGFSQLARTFREIRKLKVVFMFLLGYWLYIDGVGTIYKTAVFFADRVLGLPTDSLITALLLTQFIAFPAALGFGWLGKRIGAKPGILIGLIVYVFAIIYAWKWLETSTDFYLLAAAIGLVQGGVQSLSRSLFTRIIPRDRTTEFFGFFNMMGKFAGILGPLLMAISPLVFVGIDERDSILVLIILFVAGAVLLLKVNVAEGMRRAGAMDESPR